MTATGATNEAATDAEGHLEHGWFRVERLATGVFVIEEPLHAERVKSHLIVGRDRAVLVDTGMGVGRIDAVVAELTDLPLTVVTSHAHWDHIGGNGRFVGRVELLAHELEAAKLASGLPNDRLRGQFAPEHLRGPLPDGFAATTVAYPPSPPDRLLRGGEAIDLGGRTIEVLHAPGHAPGLLVLLDREAGVLFRTDAAYAGALYAQLDESDFEAYRRTLASLAALSPALRAVYPAHGRAVIDPALLPAMAAAFDAVADGRLPDARADGVARHRFAGFSLLVADPILARGKTPG